MQLTHLSRRLDCVLGTVDTTASLHLHPRVVPLPAPACLLGQPAHALPCSLLLAALHA